MTLKYEMLRYFTAVARSGNLADAAAELGRTPSAVSMMLKRIEEHLGAPLFEAGRKRKLTALGKFALGEAAQQLDHFEHTVAAIEGYARSESGSLRIAAVPSVAETILPAVVRDFLRDRPKLRIDIRDTDSAGVLRELERDSVDLGVASGVGAGPEIERRELFSDAFGVVCRADHPLARCELPLAWKSLAPWPFIANGLCAQIADETFQRILAESRLMVRNTTSLLALVRAGVGATVLPRLAICGTERELVFRPVADQTARRRMDILRRAHLTPSPAAQEFEDAVRRCSREVSASW